MAEIKEKFVQYLGDISNKLIDDQSSFTKQLTRIEKQFESFGLTNEQFSQIISKVNGTATQYITQYASGSSLELLKLEQQQPLINAQIALAEKDLELKEKDLLLKDKDLELKNKDLELKSKELQIKEKQLQIMAQELAIKTKQLELMAQQIAESKAKEDLTRAQVLSENKQAAMIVAQTALVTRQTYGYGDNLLIKSAEFEGSLASFAVNADSDTKQDAINKFVATVTQIKQRA